MTQQTTPLEPAAGTLLGAWAILHVAGRGGMATVHVARNVDTGLIAALKLMSPGSGADEVEGRFRREFRTLSRLRHPNITQVFDWGTWEGRPYFVMEFVEGEDLRSVVERWAVDPPEDRFEIARSVVVQVARALEQVHLQGLVHRDITPSNVMLLPDGGVKLMDFGVVKETDTTELTAHGELLGTVAYVAPEQINGERIDARTDLYSLGALLYLLLTGRRPFNARTLAGYLDKHLHRPPRPPRELVPTVPIEIEEICLRLLQKEPADRYASATHLLYVLLGPTHRGLATDGGWPPAIAGRADALSTLANALEACREGQGGVILLEGGPGSGKTRLAQLAVEMAHTAGMPATRIRARPQANPLMAYAAVYQSLRAEGLEVRPVLERAFGAESGPVRGSVERYAMFAAFRDMVTGTRPRLFVVDDLHYADPGSIELLEYLVRTTLGIGQEPLLWLLTRAPGVADAATDGLALGSRTEVASIHTTLEPLSVQDVEETLLSLVPPSSGVLPLARRLHTEGEGTPGHVAEILRGLIDEGIIAAVDGVRTLALDEAGVASAVLLVPRSIRDAALRRFATVSANARCVAEMLALARQELPVGLLAEITGLGDTEVRAAADELVEVDLVRERQGEVEEHLDVAHARLRELLYEGIPEASLPALHRLVGGVLERAYRRRLDLVAEMLAVHFHHGGVPGKAYPYMIRAGQRLLDRSFAAEAERYFERAIAIEPEARAAMVLDEADRLLADLLLRRADVLAHLGRWSEVPSGVGTAEALARELGDARLMSRAAAARGALARHLHDIEGAEARLTEAIHHADRAGDASLRVMPLNGLGAILWSRGDLEGARRSWVEELAVGEATHDERSLGYGYNGLGLVALCKGQAAEARRFFEQSAEIFERVGLLGPLAVSRVNLVEIHHFTGNLRRGLELADKTLSTAREIHHPLGVARGRGHRSLILVDLGRGAEALEEAREALVAVRDLDHREDEVSTLVALARAAWAVRDYQTLRRALEEAVAMLRYDPEGFAPIVHAWRARLAALEGDPSTASIELERALAVGGGRWPYQECRLDLVLARAYATMGDAAEATRRAEAAIRRADACGFRLYALKGHALAAAHSSDEAAVARHRRVADALARSLAANLSREDAERFLDGEQAPPVS